MEKARAGSESFLHGAFLCAAEIWDVRIGVYNIRSMAGNAIMNGETRYLTKKKPCARLDCWGPIPQEPAMRSFYLQCMRFFAKCQCAKGKMFRLFPGRGGGGAPFLGAARSGKAVCFMQRRGKRDVPAVSRAWRRGRAFLGGCEERESRLLYAAAREKGRSGCFQGAAAGARLSWGLRGAGKPIAL